LIKHSTAFSHTWFFINVFINIATEIFLLSHLSLVEMSTSQSTYLHLTNQIWYFVGYVLGFFDAQSNSIIVNSWVLAGPTNLSKV
jgi:hypothetical protein